MRTLDLTGQRFGRLLVTAFAGRRDGKARWSCRCDCGGTVAVDGWSLTSGRTKSCGCLWRESIRTHGHAAKGREHSLYKRWLTMLERCRNPKQASYRLYGARGIRVCERWHDFAAFLSDMGTPPDPSYQLDRIDGERGYEPGNVRWATRVQQIRNRDKETVRRLNGKASHVRWHINRGISNPNCSYCTEVSP